MSGVKYPDNADLLRLVRFSSRDGEIWLGENRMVLLHTAALSELRKELIGSVGLGQTRRILTRIGYASGIRDAEQAKGVRVTSSQISALLAGAQLQMLEGAAQIEPVRLNADRANGHFDGEFAWYNSTEAEAHLKAFGHTHDPVCWMQLGYLSGFMSMLMGRFILFKEVACAATGKDHCQLIGKPAEHWPDAHEHTLYFEDDSIVGHLLYNCEQADPPNPPASAKRQVGNLLGNSPAFQQTYSLITKAAATNVTVLLLGETGVGKERFARALHELSNHRHGPFVAVNCAALPHDLIESELFGVEKGAFTGANASRAGKFERADQGTLFLDEIGELPLAAQAKLLRVLQEGEIERLGSEHTRKVDIRLVTATNVDLTEAVREGRFRSDLYFRLNVYPVLIPPLRDRLADIPALVEAMLGRFCLQHGKRLVGVTDLALRALRAYDWPGNIRELENLIERGVILAPQDGWLEANHLFTGYPKTQQRSESISKSGDIEAKPPVIAAKLCQEILDAGLSLDDIEQMLLQYAVDQSGGNLASAARMLRVTRPQISYRLKKRNGNGAADRDPEQ